MDKNGERILILDLDGTVTDKAKINAIVEFGQEFNKMKFGRTLEVNPEGFNEHTIFPEWDDEAKQEFCDTYLERAVKQGNIRPDVISTLKILQGRRMENSYCYG